MSEPLEKTWNENINLDELTSSEGKVMALIINQLNTAIEHINGLEKRLEIGHYHLIDGDPFSTDEDIAYAEEQPK